MRRVTSTEQRLKITIKRSDYEEDRKRGYTVLEHKPAGVLTVKNPRNPERSFTKQIPAVHVFRCMFCKFDAADSAYSPDPETSQARTGIDIIKKHLSIGKHPWSYTVFENPYGNVEDVTIEGVEDYLKEIAS